jgi:hypothetical protein
MLTPFDPSDGQFRLAHTQKWFLSETGVIAILVQLSGIG